MIATDTVPSLSVESSPPVTILKRLQGEQNTPDDFLHRRPYHERLRNYLEVRHRIFNEISPLKSRNTVRCKKYFKRIKQYGKLLVSAIFNSRNDSRCYAEVSFLQFTEHGLLDTGANVSCVGSSLALEQFSALPEFKPLKSHVKSADGNSHEVIGVITVAMNYKDMTKPIQLYIIPAIKQRLILGVDFWKIFSLAPHVISAIESTSTESEKRLCTSEVADTNLYPLSSVQSQQLEVVKNLFPNCRERLGRTSLIQHHIDIGDSRPVKQRFYPVSPAVEILLYKEIDRMLELDVIEPSVSAWSSPMRLVMKPNKIRLCLDARKLNDATKKDAFPLPSIEGIFARMPKANIISKLDLKDAYWQIELTKESRPLTAFTIPGRPLYQFKVMPFGLCNAPATMCRLMDDLIPPDLRHCVFGYLDDVCIVSENFSEHLSVLVRLAEQFRKANLTLNIDKSHFCVNSVNYLGYVIGSGGICTDPAKIDCIKNWPPPKNLKQVRGFLGICGWYRRFIHNYADLTCPITDVLSNKKKFVWPAEAQEAMEKLKAILTSAPVLQNPDFQKKFYLHCDASNFGIGAVLVQLSPEKDELPIAYMSKKLSRAQRNYSVTERECLAVILAIEKFRCYLELQEFEVVTDHSSLLWLMRQQNAAGRLARWIFRLQPYKFTISHRKGKDHIVPDALSRISDDEVAELEIGPTIDLESTAFFDSDYKELKDKFVLQQSKFPDIKIADQFIYIKTEHATGIEAQDKSLWKLWVPTRLRADVLKQAHDSVVSSHCGMQKTIEKLRRNLYWPGLANDVRNYIRNCDTCKETKAPNHVLRPPMGLQSPTCRPFQRLYVDILGPYPRSKNGNVGLLIVLDHFSKFHWLHPLKKFTSSAIQDFLLKQVFHCFGVPETLVSDNGQQFRANDFNAFLTELGIRHVYTALYSPQSNAAERVNRSLLAAVRAYLKADQTDWDKNISAISCALRSSLHQSLGVSPYKALFGLDMITHGADYRLLKDLSLLEEPVLSLKRADNLALLRKDLQVNIRHAYERNVAQYNLRSKPVSFKEGQEVFRRNFALSKFSQNFNAKLGPQFVKCRIRKKLGNSFYQLEDLQGKEIGTYHAKDIRS